MNQRRITQDEARALIEAEGVDQPYLVINEAGRKALDQFVQDNAAEPDRHDLATWYTVGEQEANAAGPDEVIIVEIRGLHTTTGNAATLRMDADHFDWVV
ncbi:MAG: hypothetical protein KIS62_01190 [Ramlibacter sp.]|nr:hypothetical protein [Ramlibacter sp.]